MPKNESQTKLLEQLQQYIKIVIQKKPMAYRTQDVEELIISLEEGHCSGMTALWLYHKNRHTEKYFYGSIINPILAWDSRKEIFSKELENILEYTLSSVVALQASTMFKRTESGIPMLRGIVQKKITAQQTDYDVLINLIKQNDYPTLRKEYEIAFVFTNNELQDFLKTIPPNKLIQLSSIDHTIGLFFDGQEYILFDPNGFVQEGTDEHFFEKRFAANEVENLVKNIQSAFIDTPDSNVMGLIISIFDNVHNPIPNYINRVKCIQKILDARIKNKDLIDINERSSYEHACALFFAILTGHSDVVKLLLSRGADTQITNPNESNPIHLAFVEGNFAVIEALLNSPAGKKIINTPTHTPIDTPQGRVSYTPLYLAAGSGHTQIVELLLRHGANIEIEQEGNSSANPIHVASMHGHFAVLEILLNSSAGEKIIDVPLQDGMTALHLAVQNGHTKTVELLLHHEADIEKLDKDSLSAIQIAKKYGYIEIVTLLKDEQSKQSTLLQKAKHEIPKNWIDKDYANLVKIKTVYLNVDRRIKTLELEIMELSEYYLGLREPRALPVIQSKMERLNEIEEEIRDLEDKVHLKTDHIPVNNLTRRNQVVIESEKNFSDLLNNIKDCRVDGQNAEKEMQSAAIPAVTVHLPPKIKP